MAQDTTNYNLKKYEETDTTMASRLDQNSNMDVIDAELANRLDKTVGGTVAGDVIFNGDITATKYSGGTLTIPASGWSTDGAGDYPRYITISIAGITADHWVEIVITKDDLAIANDAEICPTVEEVAGGVNLYAKKELSADVSARYKVVI